MNHSLASVRAALRPQVAELMGRANVVAVGIGPKISGGLASESLCLACSVARKQPASVLSASDRIPPMLDGVPTDVVETGVIRALQSHTDRMRPAQGGVSIGHRDVTAGTLGCVVRRAGQRFVLSNNHVLAHSNEAASGDPILQPAVHDGGGLPEDRIALLHDFVPIEFSDGLSDSGLAAAAVWLFNSVAGLVHSETRLQAVRVRAAENRVDAAIALPSNGADLSSEILEIGSIQGLIAGELAMAVQKSGRTTGLTQGTIVQVDVTTDVQYGPGRIARFSDQLMAGPMSQGGDSGSAVLDSEKRLLGLLFAGSDNSTIINRIEHVFEALEVTL